MNRRCALGFWALVLVTILAFPSSSLAQGKSLKDQLVGTWIYVSSTGKRDDGSTVPRPSLQGAVTYTSDGRFHFITARTDAPKLASSDPSRPTPEEANGHCVRLNRLYRHIYCGRKHKDHPRQRRDEHVSKSCWSPQSAPDHHVYYRRRNEVHEPTHACRGDIGLRVEAGKVTVQQWTAVQALRCVTLSHS
jgi:hypothetical protein